MRDLSRPSLNDYRANASHTSLQFAINRFAATDCGNLCASDDAAETVYIHGLQTTHLEIGMKGILIGELSRRGDRQDFRVSESFSLILSSHQGRLRKCLTSAIIRAYKVTV
jgi:hypothetical protein